ncbi:hypothetical protein ACWCQL_32910 [Streptomyces sp. NPDC002073]
MDPRTAQDEPPTPLLAIAATPTDPVWQQPPFVWRKPGMLAVCRLTTGLNIGAYMADAIPTGAPITAAASLVAFHALYEFGAAWLRPTRR